VCEVIIGQSASYVGEGPWIGTDEEVVFSLIRVTADDLRGHLEFPDDWLQKIVAYFDDWDDKGYLPDLWNFKEWVHDDLMNMWFQNETMRVIGEMSRLEPWSRHTMALYEALEDHEVFPARPWSLMECRGLLDKQINRLIPEILAEQISKSYPSVFPDDLFK
jgi:hypothetical protein